MLEGDGLDSKQTCERRKLTEQLTDDRLLFEYMHLLDDNIPTSFTSEAKQIPVPDRAKHTRTSERFFRHYVKTKARNKVGLVA